jgi:hypothetical protein
MASARVTICSPFFNDRRQRLVINSNRFHDPRSPTPRIPRLDFINWEMSMAAATSLQPICRGLLGSAVFTAATKERFGPVRFYCRRRDGAHDRSRQSRRSALRTDDLLASVGFVGHSLAGIIGEAFSGTFLQTAAITIVTGSGSQNPSKARTR